MKIRAFTAFRGYFTFNFGLRPGFGGSLGVLSYYSSSSGFFSLRGAVWDKENLRFAGGNLKATVGGNLTMLSWKCRARPNSQDARGVWDGDKYFYYLIKY